MKILWFKHWPILPKIMMISIISITLMIVAITFYLTPMIEDKMMEVKKEEIKNVVDVAFGIFLESEAQVKSGKISIKEAQEQVAERISKLRYGDKEYFWINDLHPFMIMHPINPELNGKDITDNHDPDGTYLFKECVKVAKSKGAGYVHYKWPKPGENEAVQKVSYIRLYQPWGWILGSGIYVDDVKRDLAQLRAYMLGGTILFTVVTLFIASLIGTGITSPLKKVISGLQDIASGKGDVSLTKRIAITSIDEIGLLSSEFNSVMESISNLTVFKKVIEEEDSLEEVYIRLGEAFSKHLGLHDCIIYTFSATNNHLTIAYPPDLSDDEIHCKQEIFENCYLCKAKRTAHVISSSTFPVICRQFHASSGMEHYCIPLIVGGVTVGVVQFIYQSTDDRAKQKQNELNMLKAEQYIKESLPVIETRRLMHTLSESALRDPMTGLHNRRYLQEYTEKLVAGAARRGKKIGLIMCDLDFFKQVNDTLGHTAGDMVLKETAAIIRKNVRESDIVIRFGGEEFLVVLLDINEDESMKVAEKIREEVQNNKIKLDDGNISKTISLGISEFPRDAGTFWSCIKFADVALYKAKDGGRNRSIRFSHDMWTEDQV